jgi:hypothetical protein
VIRFRRFVLAGLLVGGLLAAASPAQAARAPAPEVKFKITPTKANFGLVFVGATSLPVVFTAENVGRITSGPAFAFTIGGNKFDIVQDTCTGASVAPGGTCSVSVVFDPLVSGIQNGQLWVGQPPDYNTVGFAQLAGRAIQPID